MGKGLEALRTAPRLRRQPDPPVVKPYGASATSDPAILFQAAVLLR